MWAQSAIAITRVLLGRKLNPLTVDEAAAGVTPVDYAYEEGDSRRYASLADFLAVAGRGIPSTWYGGDYQISAPLDVPGDAYIRIHGRVTVTATAAVDYILRHAGELHLWGGPLVLDGNGNVAYSGFHSTSRLPSIDLVHVRDCPIGFSTGSDYSSITDDVEGDGHYRRCHAEDCYRAGFAIRGASAQKVASVVFEHCRTSGATGGADYSGGRGWTVICRGMRSVRFIGGDFTGHALAYTTSAIHCDHAEIHGGYYYGIERGPTMGISTTHFVVQGVVAKDCAGIGVSLDTTDSVGETPGIGVVSNNIASNCGRAFRSTCSYLSVTDNLAYECQTVDGMFAFAGDDHDVFVAGNYCYSTTNPNGTNYVAFSATESTVVRYAENYTNSSSARAYGSSNPNTWGIFGDVRVVTADYDVSFQDKKIFVDCSGGTVDIDLPSISQAMAEGHTFSIVKLDAANPLTISVTGGLSGGSINGANSFTVPASHQYREVKVTCVDPVTGAWVCDGGTGNESYTISNITPDRTLNGLSLTLDDVAAVLGTLINDLKANRRLQ